MNRILIIALLFIFVGCAKKGSITGGVKDTIPPSFVGSIPKNYSTQFKGKTIKLSFDEFVKFKEINKQLVVSPPLKNPPIITPTTASKNFSITITDTLKENTTYSLNFGQSLQDNNEGNPLNQFRYVFSTGDYIDSLTVGGRIKDALDREVDNFVSVMLYEVDENYNDSIIYKQTPRYITNTLDSMTVWRIDNIKEGKYQLIALKDKNRNNKYDPKSDKIGFLKQPISIPNDTIFPLELFKEDVKFKALKPSLDQGNKLILGYEGNPKNISVTLKNNQEELKTAITQISGKDSLNIWFPSIKTDSLHLNIKRKDYSKDFTVKIKAQKSDSLNLKNITVGNLSLRKNFEIEASVPVDHIEKSLIQVFDKDSVAVEFETTYEANTKKISLLFEPKPSEKYNVNLLPGAITDFYNRKNDSINYKVSTKDVTDYGNLRVQLENVKQFPVMVELVDSKGKILAQAYSEGKTELDFNYLEPATYIMRLFYDDNKNKEWDSGNFLQKRQPEQVIYFSKEIQVRANWDYEQPFRLP